MGQRAGHRGAACACTGEHHGAAGVVEDDVPVGLVAAVYTLDRELAVLAVVGTGRTSTDMGSAGTAMLHKTGTRVIRRVQ